MEFRTVVEPPPALARFTETAVMRLRARYPAAQITLGATGVDIAHSDAEIGREAAAALGHLLYQERIYEEGRPQRAALYAKLLQG